MDPCTVCAGVTAPHCLPVCNRGWVRCRSCRAFGRQGGPMIPAVPPPVVALDPPSAES